MKRTLIRDIVPKSTTMWGGGGAETLVRLNGKIKRGAFQIRQVPGTLTEGVRDMRCVWNDREMFNKRRHE